MNIIVLGAPGAGKGTQAEIISDLYNIPIIGTGNIIREAMKAGSELGKQVSDFMDRGALVPDETVIQLLKNRVERPDSQNGFVLDGFPRSVVQAKALDEMGVRIDKVVSIEVADDEILRRLSGRTICGKCGSSYHIEYKKPLVPEVCDRCGGELVVRKDDDPEIIKERLIQYHQITYPVKDYYKKSGKLFEIQGQEQVEDTTKLTLAALEE